MAKFLDGQTVRANSKQALKTMLDAICLAKSTTIEQFLFNNAEVVKWIEGEFAKLTFAAEDDGLPIDELWLRGEGFYGDWISFFRGNEFQLQLFICFHGYDCPIGENAKAFIYRTNRQMEKEKIEIAFPKTRKDVRLLCDVFSISPTCSSVPENTTAKVEPPQE